MRLRIPIFRYPTMITEVQRDSQGNLLDMSMRKLITESRTQVGLQGEDNPVHIQCGDTEEIVDLEEIIEFYLKNR